MPSSMKWDHSKLLCVAGEESSTDSLQHGPRTEDKDGGAQGWCTTPPAAENLVSAAHWALLNRGLCSVGPQGRSDVSYQWLEAKLVMLKAWACSKH